MKKPYRIFYDGTCPMCTAVVGAVEKSKAGEQFKNVDMHTGELPEGVTKEMIDKEMYVVGNDGTTYKNAEAILKILEHSKYFSFLATLGRLPLIRTILPLGYDFISKRRHRLFGEQGRAFWLLVLTVLGMLTMMMMSPPLWLLERSFPYSPFISGVGLPLALENILFWIMVTLFVTALVSKHPRKYILGGLLLLATLIFVDQNRLHAWTTHFISILIVLGVYSWRVNQKEFLAKVLNTTRFIIVAIYFWAGIQKIGVNFFVHVWPQFVSGITWWIPEQFGFLIFGVGLIVPFFEALIGVGLLFKRTRVYALWGAFVMFITIVLSLGFNFGLSVIVWNVVLFGSALILFVNTPHVRALDILWVRKFFLHKILLVLIGILPVLSYFHIWHNNVSWHMHSGRTQNASIEIQGFPHPDLPDAVHIASRANQAGNSHIISIHHWAIVSLFNIPTAEKPVFKDTFSYICKYHPDAVLTINDARSPFTTEPKRTMHDCTWMR